MAGTRVVHRGSRGRFAGASAGKAERVKAGGFANAAFRARVQSQRAAKKNTLSSKMGRGFKAVAGVTPKQAVKQAAVSGAITAGSFATAGAISLAASRGKSARKVGKTRALLSPYTAGTKRNKAISSAVFGRGGR